MKLNLPVLKCINSLNLIYQLIAILCIFLAFSSNSILADHPGDTGLTDSGIFDPMMGGSTEPLSQIQISIEQEKGAKENQSIYTNTIFFEHSFYKNIFSANISIPYHYFDQKDKKDAGRFGKVYSGFKIFLFRSKLKNAFFILDGRIGLPTGRDTDRFVDKDFWDASGGLSAGYKISNFSAGVRWGGQMPLTGLRPKNNTEQYVFTDSAWLYDSLQYHIDSVQLKKTTELSFFFRYSIRKIVSLYAGYYMRTPFDGIIWEEPEKEKNYLIEPFDPAQYMIDKKYSSHPSLPQYFEEAYAGIALNFNEKYSMNLAWRYPMERAVNIRPYESVVLVSFSMRFNAEDHENDNHDHSRHEH